MKIKSVYKQSRSVMDHMCQFALGLHESGLNYGVYIGDCASAHAEAHKRASEQADRVARCHHRAAERLMLSLRRRLL